MRVQKLLDVASGSASVAWRVGGRTTDEFLKKVDQELTILLDADTGLPAKKFMRGVCDVAIFTPQPEHLEKRFGVTLSELNASP